MLFLSNEQETLCPESINTTGEVKISSYVELKVNKVSELRDLKFSRR